jgi:hypothetical protein
MKCINQVINLMCEFLSQLAKPSDEDQNQVWKRLGVEGYSGSAGIVWRTAVPFSVSKS